MANTIKVGINGFGRIGRAFLKIAWERPEIEIVAVNDLGDVANLAYLLKHDTVYRTWNHDVKANGQELVIDGKVVKVLAEKDPANLPWGAMAVDVVVESTGLFVTFDKANAHVKAGAKKVVISAPAKEGDGSVQGETILLGVNEDKFGTCAVTSNASCTTNAASPLIAILHEVLGIEKAVLNTVHGYTASQSIVDGPNKKDFREGRAAAQNIVPASTGAAIAVTKAFPELTNLFDGISMRVPVPAGSIVDITFISKKPTTAQEVNDILKKAAMDPKWSRIFSVTEEALVSSDILGESHASIAQLDLTRVVGGNLVKVMGWYDNEMGYTHTLVEHVIKTGLKINN
ncbi:MAG: type I glyceraldehyde-3-phosphate dehydrogenase [Candidatus Nomurabacteria bacterium]|nr:type I glyceraldehyde-3-phosphate dehydrogenase [Candidatus Nomurabacteria bacterium]